MAPEPPKKEFSWKPLFIKAAGFGAGCALLVFVLGSGLLWYSTRPKAWNSRAITAKFGELTIQRTGLGSAADLNAFFVYGIHNALPVDYDLPEQGNAELMGKGKENQNLSILKNASWDAIRIPSNQTVNVKFTLTWHLADYNTTAEQLDDEKKLIEFAEKRLKEAYSMEFFDYSKRYEITLPELPSESPKK